MDLIFILPIGPVPLLVVPMTVYLRTFCFETTIVVYGAISMVCSAGLHKLWQPGYEKMEIE